MAPTRKPRWMSPARRPFPWICFRCQVRAAYPNSANVAQGMVGLQEMSLFSIEKLCYAPQAQPLHPGCLARSSAALAPGCDCYPAQTALETSLLAAILKKEGPCMRHYATRAPQVACLVPKASVSFLVGANNYSGSGPMDASRPLVQALMTQRSNRVPRRQGCGMLAMEISRVTWVSHRRKGLQEFWSLSCPGWDFLVGTP